MGNVSLEPEEQVYGFNWVALMGPFIPSVKNRKLSNLRSPDSCEQLWTEIMWDIAKEIEIYFYSGNAMQCLPPEKQWLGPEYWLYAKNW